MAYHTRNRESSQELEEARRLGKEYMRKLARHTNRLWWFRWLTGRPIQLNNEFRNGDALTRAGNIFYLMAPVEGFNWMQMHADNSTWATGRAAVLRCEAVLKLPAERLETEAAAAASAAWPYIMAALLDDANQHIIATTFLSVLELCLEANGSNPSNFPLSTRDTRFLARSLRLPGDGSTRLSILSWPK